MRSIEIIKEIVETIRPDYWKIKDARVNTFACAEGIERQMVKKEFGIKPCAIAYLSTVGPFMGNETGTFTIAVQCFDVSGNPITDEEYNKIKPEKWSRND